MAAAIVALDDDAADMKALGYGLAFVWVPAAGALEAWRRRRPGSRGLAWASGLLDLVAFAAIAAAADDAWWMVQAGALVTVTLYAYQCGAGLGIRLGLLFGAAAVAFAPDGVDTPVAPAPTAILFPVLLLTLVWLEHAADAARREAEFGIAELSERSEVLLSGIAEAIVVTSPRGLVRQWNRGARRTFDRSSDTTIGLPCREALGLRRELVALDCSRGCALLAQLSEQAGSAVDVEVWRMRDDGRRQPLLATALAVTDARGEPVEVVHSFRDVTGIKAADEAKTMFLATASHELRTPLAVILGFSELLADRADLSPAERHHAHVAIRDRAQQLNGIVNRLLLSSRIESGTVELDVATVDVAPILHERVGALGPATGRTVVLDCPVDLPHVRGNDDALTTTIDHLLDNAMKFSAPAAPVTVTAAADDRSVSIAIADRGIGMSEADVEHCFDRFWQSDTSDSRRFGGTGIGLYVVRSLVEAMDAEIGVASVPGQGSVFTITLTRADAPSAEVVSSDETDQPSPEPSIIREFMRQIGVPPQGGQR